MRQMRRRDANYRRRQAMVRHHREGRISRRSRSRLTDLEMAAMLHGGATLDEIGKRAGLTRERVRQRLRRIGVSAATRIDAMKLLEAVRTRPIHTLAALARTLGLQKEPVARALLALGLIDAVERLFRLRARARQRAKRERVALALRAYAKQLGRTPAAVDILSFFRPREIPCLKTLQQLFGSLTQAQLAAGLRPHRRRRPKSAHGALALSGSSAALGPLRDGRRP